MIMTENNIIIIDDFSPYADYNSPDVINIAPKLCSNEDIKTRKEIKRVTKAN